MILTESRLRLAAEEARNNFTYYAINESLTHFDTAQIYDLFISHSFKDKDQVIGLQYLFNQAGYTVYIDWIEDSQLDRNYVTSETAELIKMRIRQSRGTSYIATTNSAQSKWCPWELGLSDGMKGRTCILPIMTSIFIGQEYLSLYPYLEYSRIQDQARGDFLVYDQKNHRKYINLSSWLMGNDPYLH